MFAIYACGLGSSHPNPILPLSDFFWPHGSKERRHYLILGFSLSTSSIIRKGLYRFWIMSYNNTMRTIERLTIDIYFLYSGMTFHGGF